MSTAYLFHDVAAAALLSKPSPKLSALFSTTFQNPLTFMICNKPIPKPKIPRYFIRTPYNGVLASQTRHDYCPQSSMIRGVMSPGLVGRW
ncbi:hypothetical protein C7B06_25070 [Escherichia coli]|nr:hypothetical protein C7B06_25070 [Escherichia coli]